MFFPVQNMIPGYTDPPLQHDAASGLYLYKSGEKWILGTSISPKLKVGGTTLTTAFHKYNARDYYVGGGKHVWWNGVAYVFSQYLGVQSYMMSVDGIAEETEQIVSHSCATLEGEYVSNEEAPTTLTATLEDPVASYSKTGSVSGEYQGVSPVSGSRYVGWRVIKLTPVNAGFKSIYKYETGTIVGGKPQFAFFAYGNETLGEGKTEESLDTSYVTTVVCFAADGEAISADGIDLGAMPAHVFPVYIADSNFFM